MVAIPDRTCQQSEAMRASRLLVLLMTLQKAPRHTAAGLAETLGVSLRTVYRDLGALGEAGVPLWSETGPGGGVGLVEGWRSRLDALTGEEAAALFVASVPQVVAAFGWRGVAERAQAKVEGGLPAASRVATERVRQRFLLVAEGWFARAQALDALPVLADAVWRGVRLSLAYGSPARRRRVDPLGLVLKAGQWYLVAAHRRVLKTFRVDRVARATLLEAGVVRPEGFVLEAWWHAHEDQFAQELLRYPCVVRLSAAGRRRLAAVVPQASVQAALRGVVGDGEAEVALTLESESVALGQLVAAGDGVEVLAPPALRAAMRALGERLAARHRGG